MGLAEHRPDAAHLPHQPLHGDGALAGAGGIQFAAGLFRQINQDGAGLEHVERLTARPVRIDDAGNLVVGADFQEFGVVLFALADIDLVDVVIESQFFQHDGDLAAVRRAPSIQVDHF